MEAVEVVCDLYLDRIEVEVAADDDNLEEDVDLCHNLEEAVEVDVDLVEEAVEDDDRDLDHIYVCLALKFHRESCANRKDFRNRFQTQFQIQS